MKKMLYTSHIDWNWIKQRPQFLAEGLHEHLDVTVAYMYQNSKRETLTKGKNHTLPTYPIYSIPFAARMGWSRKIGEWFQRLQYRRIFRKCNPDSLYFTFPTQLSLLPDGYEGTVIYDCMDNYLAMVPAFLKPVVLNYEPKLIRRADYILVSSQKLKEMLLEKYGTDIESKMVLVRNGYNGNVLPAAAPSSANDTFTISYIGTIGSWFNFEYILKSLDEFPNLEYRIIGPADNPDLPVAERLVYLGTVEHDKLYDAIADVQCLTMPFQLNEIVEAVDPVKLYEYINFNKNILCIRYKEIERFEPFVYFYTDYDSFRNQIDSMMKNPTLRYNQSMRESFLMENSWKTRVDQIMQAINSHES